MHAASIHTSERLQSIIRLLTDRMDFGATTLEIVDELRTMNPGRDISEINKGFRDDHDQRRIICEYQGTTESGRRVFRYRLIRELAA